MKKKDLQEHIKRLEEEIMRLRAENEQLERLLSGERSNIQRIIIHPWQPGYPHYPTYPYTPPPYITRPPDTAHPLTPPFIVTC